MRNDMRTQNRTVPLAALVDGDANVRSTATSRDAMEELKASILAHQLIGRLAVREQPGESDRYGVVAGHRRYKALQELLEEKKIDASYPVPIRVLDGTDDDLEIALAENVCRVAMEPLDQCATFVRLIDGGAAIDEIATRFGISKRTVEQRLRLTNLAPDVIAAYKAGDINYETMSAFGNTTDHELQARTLERVQYAYAVTAKTVEAALRNEHVPATSAKARYIGLNAYEEAGGHVETNLFGDDDSTYLVDVELLDRLVMEKLQAKANALMKRWKWAEARLQFGYADTQGLGRVEPKAGEYTEKEQTELTLHESEMDRIAEIVNGGVDEDSEKTAELREEYGNHERAIATLQQKVQRRSQFSAAQRKIAGCHVSLGGDGRVSITYGLVRPEDVPQPAPKTAAKKAATKAGTNGQAPETGQESSDAPADNAGTGGEAPVEEVVVIGPRGATYGGAPSGGKDREKTAVEKAGLNQALADDLRHVRVALVRHHLAKDPDAALDLLLFTQLRGGAEPLQRQPAARRRVPRDRQHADHARRRRRDRLRGAQPGHRDAGSGRGGAAAGVAERARGQGEVRGAARAPGQRQAAPAGAPDREGPAAAAVDGGGRRVGVRGDRGTPRDRLRGNAAPLEGAVLEPHHEGPDARDRHDGPRQAVGRRAQRRQEGGARERDGGGVLRRGHRRAQREAAGGGRGMDVPGVRGAGRQAGPEGPEGRGPQERRHEAERPAQAGRQPGQRGSGGVGDRARVPDHGRRGADTGGGGRVEDLPKPETATPAGRARHSPARRRGRGRLPPPGRGRPEGRTRDNAMIEQLDAGSETARRRLETVRDRVRGLGTRSGALGKRTPWNESWEVPVLSARMARGAEIDHLDMRVIYETEEEDNRACGCVIGVTMGLFPEETLAAGSYSILASTAVRRVLGLDLDTGTALFFGDPQVIRSEDVRNNVLEDLTPEEVAGAIDRILAGARGRSIWDPAEETEAGT